MNALVLGVLTGRPIRLPVYTLSESPKNPTPSTGGPARERAIRNGWKQTAQRQTIQRVAIFILILTQIIYCPLVETVCLQHHVVSDFIWTPVNVWATRDRYEVPRTCSGWMRLSTYHRCRSQECVQHSADRNCLRFYQNRLIDKSDVEIKLTGRES